MIIYSNSFVKKIVVLFVVEKIKKGIDVKMRNSITEEVKTSNGDHIEYSIGSTKGNLEALYMRDGEGLILQGCGGNLQEWIDGINGILTSENILLNGDTFKDVIAFENEGSTNLLFKMDNVKLDVGKFAMWRLTTHENFGGTWLSDYLTNQLGVDREQHKQANETNKPDCPLIGADGNVFSVMGLASKTLKACGMYDEAKEMCERVQNCGSYNEALATVIEYVNPVSENDLDQTDGEDFQMDWGM